MRAKAHVHHVDVVVDGPLQREDELRDVALPGRVEDLQRVEIDVRGNARDEIAVLLGGEDSRDVRAVAVVVVRVFVAVREVVAALVVAQELGVDDVRRVVRIVVEIVDPGVDDRDLHAGATDARRVDRRRSDVLDAPGVLVFVIAGVGSVVEGDDGRVELDSANALVGGELLELAAWDAGGDGIRQLESVADLAAALLDGGLGCFRRLGVVRDDDLHELAVADAVWIRDRGRGERLAR